MNLPNKLTVLRIILTPIFMFTLVCRFPFHYFISLIIFVAASLTDLYDGKIARARGLVTDFGKFLDPLADKMLTTAAFLGFIELGIGEGIVWITFIVLFREFMVSSIRLIASTSGGKVIAANIWGKLKTVFQMIAIIFGLTAAQTMELLRILGVPSEIYGVIGAILSAAVTILLWVSAVLCVVSGVIYLLDNKEFITKTK
ncbi:MAG: CDP-diacylglycerol--glycerol-3-phosphate 3-phosphatidyltransferase [Acutalibacteraceae bacterium]|nr:CDP-diacylglycerol--glycerol-3-phosphate 3-phosphatidyltransferase [Acutalibacteraceae bacterium]